MFSSGHAQAKNDTFIANLLFWGILAAVCAWVLLLPVFPTQDGPMHRYYVHVIGSLLAHQGTYSVYEIRHPFPPYLTQYGTLLVLFHLFSYDLAEKLFTCLVLVCVAGGLKFSARQVGPRGRWIACLCAPVLLAWPLMMGFFNFTLAVGLMLVCTGSWQRLPRSGGRAFAGFMVAMAILTVTHPIPLLLLILFCGFDLLLSFFFRLRTESASNWLRNRRFQAIALASSCVAAVFPALAVDSTQTGTTLAHFRFSEPFLKTSLLLTGVSPYNTRSHDLWINVYRLALYALFVGCMWAGGRAAIRSLRRREPDFGTTAFFATALAAIALPFLPEGVNGSHYFTTRLIFVLWLGAFLAASAGAEPQGKSRRLFVLAAVLCCAVTLVPAQIFIRPAGWELRQAELQPIPPGVPGLVLLGYHQQEWVRFHKQLAFDPFQWAIILPFVREDDVALDTPWIDQKILPIEAVPGGPELVSDVANTLALEPGDVDAPLVPGRSLPGRAEAAMVRASSFILFSGTPAQVAQGLATQLSPSEAAKYRCAPARDWYLLCTSK